MTDDRSKEYRAKFSEGLIRLIMQVGMSEDGKTSVVLAGEIVDEMLSCMAMLMHGSEAVTTPANTREFCNEIARKLQRRISETQRLAATGGLNFIQTVKLGDEQ